MNSLTKAPRLDILLVNGQTITGAEIVSALEASAGNLTEAAEALGIRRHELAQHIRSSAELTAIHTDYLEAAVDQAQQVVFKAVKNGNMEAATFLLSTLGKERGFSNKTELTFKREVAIEEMSEEELFQRAMELRRRFDAAFGPLDHAEPIALPVSNPTEDAPKGVNFEALRRDMGAIEG